MRNFLHQFTVESIGHQCMQKQDGFNNLKGKTELYFTSKLPLGKPLRNSCEILRRQKRVCNSERIQFRIYNRIIV